MGVGEISRAFQLRGVCVEIPVIVLILASMSIDINIVEDDIDNMVTLEVVVCCN